MSSGDLPIQNSDLEHGPAAPPHLGFLVMGPPWVRGTGSMDSAPRASIRFQTAGSLADSGRAHYLDAAGRRRRAPRRQHVDDGGLGRRYSGERLHTAPERSRVHPFAFARLRMAVSERPCWRANSLMLSWPADAMWVAALLPVPSRTRARGANRQDGGAHPSGKRADGSKPGSRRDMGPVPLILPPIADRRRVLFPRCAAENGRYYRYLRMLAVRSGGKIANLGRQSAPLRGCESIGDRQ
jgi:hypothetical protein